MWSYTKNVLNTQDIDNDGYINHKGMLNYNRIRDVSFNEKTKEDTIDLYSFKEFFGDKGLEIVDKFFQQNRITQGKISIDQDFNSLLALDENLNTKISAKEIKETLRSSINLEEIQKP